MYNYEVKEDLSYRMIEEVDQWIVADVGILDNIKEGLWKDIDFQGPFVLPNTRKVYESVYFYFSSQEIRDEALRSSRCR